MRVLHRNRRPHADVTIDPLGTAFDVFLSGKYEHAGGLGTHLTPTTVAMAMARIGLAMLGPTPWTGGTVAADPCCGTGRFLVAIIETLRSHQPTQLTALEWQQLLSAEAFYCSGDEK